MRPLLPTLLALTTLAACTEISARPAGSLDAGLEEGHRLSQRGVAHLLTRDGRQLQVEVEIASNDRDRTRGLMYRKTMPEMSGMFFVFPEEGLRSFWMRNTYLPLDMLFVAADGRIVGIVENAEPLTTRSRSVDGDSKFVLEVNGGWCARHGVEAGDTARLEGMYELE